MRRALIATLALALGFPAAAEAHAHLLDLRPEPEAVVAHPPASVRLVFNEPVDIVTRATGLTAHGQTVAAVVGGRSGRHVVELRPSLPLGAGRVGVHFRVLSRDGHVLHGRYGFSIRRGEPPRSGSLDLAQSGSGSAPAVTVAHGLHHLLLVLALGLALIGPGVLAAAGLSFPLRALRLLCVLAALAALATAAETWLAAEGLGAWRAVLPGTLADAAGTSAGAGWLLRAGLWVIAALVARWGVVRAGVLAAVVLSIALDGHAASHGGAGSVAVDVVHLVAAGAWLGGLAVLAGALRAGGDAARATAAFARTALASFAVLVASGAVNGLLRVGSLHAFVDAGYGRLVLAKLAVALAIAAVAAVATLRPGRVAVASRAQLTVELGLGAAALTLAALLVESAPLS